MRLKEDTMSQTRHYNNAMRIKETHINYANQKQIQELSGYGPLKHILHLKGETIDKKNGYGPPKKWSSPPFIPLQDQEG